MECMSKLVNFNFKLFDYIFDYVLKFRINNLLSI